MSCIKNWHVLLLGGTKFVLNRPTSSFNDQFKFGTIKDGLGKLRFFGLNIIQHLDLTADIDAGDKVKAVE